MDKDQQAKTHRGNALKLLPLLGFYVLFGIFNNKSDLRGDEFRYLIFVQNILHGFFASSESLMFWNGPGYPLYLTPFIAFKLPLIIPRLGNAGFLFFTIVYFYFSLLQFGVINRALLYAYLLGFLLLFHGPLIDLLMSECLSVFLVMGATYHYFRYIGNQMRSRLHLLLAGTYLAYLVWTKVFFAYAVETSLLIALGFFGVERWRRSSRNAPSAGAILICLLALVGCLPYLVYTWSATGRMHFWGNSGGVQLYCMSVPEKKLVGDWLNFDTVRGSPEFFGKEATFFVELSGLDFYQRDEAFQKAALVNIHLHPEKYFWNWRANINRLVFGFPVSPYPGADKELTTGNRTFVYALPFLLLLFALIPGWLGRKAVPSEVHVALFFALISLGGLSLLSGIPRQAFPLLPILGFWTILVFEKVIYWENPSPSSRHPKIVA
jgi:hypothetical protein